MKATQKVDEPIQRQPNHSSEKQQKNVEAIVKDILDYGDMLLISEKGHGKTEALKTLASRFRAQPNTRVIVFEDFPKWINEYEPIPFMRIRDKDVIETEHTIDVENYFLRHERSFTVKRGSAIKEALNENKDLIFLMQTESIEKTAFFIYSVVRYFYRKHYLRAYKGYSKFERVVFIVEESQNCFDSSIISKKIFNKLRKIFSVARNLGLHFILASQRMQDLNTKIRARTRLMLGRISLDDYELKIRRLLRHSKYRKDILHFDRGIWLYVATDTEFQMPLLSQQKYKPYEIMKPQKKQPQPQKEGFLMQIYKKLGIQQKTEQEVYNYEKESEEEGEEWNEFLATEEEWQEEEDGD